MDGAGEHMPKTLILCSCEGSQAVDADAMSRATGLACGAVCDRLCTDQMARAAEAIQAGPTVIACAQEASRFEALAEGLDAAPPECIDLRDRAGWGAEGAGATAKMAALLAEGLRPAPPVKTRDVTSHGACLILAGPALDIALEAAEALAPALQVTLLLPPGEAPALGAAFETVSGRLTSATGSLGRFALRFDALAEPAPGGRGAPRFGPARDGAASECDVILDLSGGAPLFPAHEKRDGYLRADPADPRAVAAALREAAELVGTFEKTLHVALDPLLCAHSRARARQAAPGASTPARPGRSRRRARRWRSIR